MAISSIERFLGVDACPAETALVIFGGFSPCEILVLTAVNKDFKTYFRGVWIWKHFLFVDFAYYYKGRDKQGVWDKDFINQEIVKQAEHLLKVKVFNPSGASRLINSPISNDAAFFFQRGGTNKAAAPDLSNLSEIYQPIPSHVALEEPNSESCFLFYKDIFVSIYHGMAEVLDPKNVTDIRRYFQRQAVMSRRKKEEGEPPGWGARFIRDMADLFLTQFVIMPCAIVFSVVCIFGVTKTILFARAFFKRCTMASS